MEGKHVLLLAVTPIALCFMGAFGLRVANEEQKHRSPLGGSVYSYQLSAISYQR